MLYSNSLEFIHLALKKNSFRAIDEEVPISRMPPPLATTSLFCVSVSSAILDMSYKWNHAAFVPRGVAYFFHK